MTAGRLCMTVQSKSVRPCLRCTSALYETLHRRYRVAFRKRDFVPIWDALRKQGRSTSFHGSPEHNCAWPSQEATSFCSEKIPSGVHLFQ